MVHLTTREEEYRSYLIEDINYLLTMMNTIAHKYQEFCKNNSLSVQHSLAIKLEESMNILNALLKENVEVIL
jgi:hypothetical protein